MIARAHNTNDGPLQMCHPLVQFSTRFDPTTPTSSTSFIFPPHSFFEADHPCHQTSSMQCSSCSCVIQITPGFIDNTEDAVSLSGDEEDEGEFLTNISCSTGYFPLHQFTPNEFVSGLCTTLHHTNVQGNADNVTTPCPVVIIISPLPDCDCHGRQHRGAGLGTQGRGWHCHARDHCNLPQDTERSSTLSTLSTSSPPSTSHTQCVCSSQGRGWSTSQISCEALRVELRHTILHSFVFDFLAWIHRRSSWI